MGRHGKATEDVALRFIHRRSGQDVVRTVLLEPAAVSYCRSRS